MRMSNSKPTSIAEVTITTTNDVNSRQHQNSSNKLSSFPGLHPGSASSVSPSSTSSLSHNGENLSNSNSAKLIEEKKRKLTLPLPSSPSNPASNANSSTSNEPNLNMITVQQQSSSSSVNSTDTNLDQNHNNNSSSINNFSLSSNKRIKTLYTPAGGVITLPANYGETSTSSSQKDLIANLELGVANLPTPDLNKLLLEYNTSAANSGQLKTPGSALAILTPNTSINLFNSMSMIGGSGLMTPSISLTTPSSDLIGNSSTNYTNLSNIIFNNNNAAYSDNNSNNNNNNNLYLFNNQINQNNSDNNSNNQNSTAVTPGTVVNPNYIFTLQNHLNQPHSQNQTNNLINGGNGMNQQYATLTSINDKFSNTGNNATSYVTLEPVKANIKDEHLQTVPSNLFTNATNKQVSGKGKRATTAKIKASSQSDGLNNNSAVNLGINNHPTTSSQMVIMNGNGISSNGLMMVGTNLHQVVKKEPKAPAGAIASFANSRRDTENSLLSNLSSNSSSEYGSSNLESNDPADCIKIEKKRERNRLAAQKCRTRKLEKIESLEKQVKTLTEANEAQRSKSRQLIEEIQQLKQKFEMHAKMHNCDLKVV